MDDWREFTAKTVDEALTEALLQLKTTSENVEYEIIERESIGFLGLFNNKPARIRIRVKDSTDKKAKIFLDKIFTAMGINANVDVFYDEEASQVNVQIVGTDMGVLIGKRGQTLDSLQYLTSLVVNKGNEGYLKVKLDTENYRERRKETLENLATNIAFKVKRSHKPIYLEPMNPYERRIIHAALQNDKFVDTHSEGEEPYRKVVITLKKGLKEFNQKPQYGNKTNLSNRKPSGQNKEFVRKKVSDPKEFEKKYGGNTKDYSKDYKKDYAAYLESKAAAKAAAEVVNKQEET